MADGIERLRAALKRCPPDHSLRPSYLNLLARSLRIRFKQQGVSSDLDEAIDLQRAALALCPPGHSYRFSSLNNLASNLRTRFEQQGVMSDLDEVIDLHRTALALHSPSHSDQSSSRNNLAISLQERFEQQGVLHDLDEAIDLHRATLALYPLHHPNRSISLRNLAVGLRDRFKWQGLSPDLDEAFGLYAQLLQVSHTVSHHDLEAAKSWVISAEQLKHSSALDAYQTALRFLDDWQHIDGVSSSSRYFDMVREATSSLAMDAFACSIHHGALTTAVELLEQGRAVFWTQLARFNAPLDDICGSGDIGKGLAAEFKEISFRLRNMLEDPTINRMTEIHQLTKERDDVISRIRMLPDFSRFLLPPLFSDLQKSAKNGPVIIVNASPYGCDALIIQSSQDPVHVPLDITQAKVSELSTEFRFITEDAGFSDDRLSVHRIVGILRQLWEHIVGPIVKALRELIIPGSRIWWCPTAEFTLLPLHVAGPYEKKSRNLPHLYISSYIPTLAALIRARQQVARDTSTSRFVAIGQGTPDKGKVLPRVAAELGDIAQCVAPILPFTSLTASNATVRQALEALSRHQWVHLACHGMPNRKKPFESSFAMYDGPLTVTDIIRTYPQNHEFAFLSACHTTVGHASSPDEAIHLAAAMQFSGFRSVIGSMWSVDDEFVGQLVSTFYDYMFDDSGRLDCSRAAVALHETVKKLRKKIPFEQQIVLIHIGV
jgi:CHAT domain-containing protein/tetratricopeptide (TPR) repeat protein